MNEFNYERAVLERALENLCRLVAGSSHWQEKRDEMLARAKKELAK